MVEGGSIAGILTSELLVQGEAIQRVMAAPAKAAGGLLITLLAAAAFHIVIFATGMVAVAAVELETFLVAEVAHLG